MSWSPFHVEGAERTGPWLVTCDHAANTVPEGVIAGGSLGIADEDMHRHIAYDVGAKGVARHLARQLGSPLIYTDFSRLVIDPNRNTDDPTVLMKLYDGTVIPANRHADEVERARRVALCHQPYHDAYEDLASRPGIAVCAVHSFTPQFRGRSWRPWEVAVLWAKRRQDCPTADRPPPRSRPDGRRQRAVLGPPRRRLNRPPRVAIRKAERPRRGPQRPHPRRGQPARLGRAARSGSCSSARGCRSLTPRRTKHGRRDTNRTRSCRLPPAA